MAGNSSLNLLVEKGLVKLVCCRVNFLDDLVYTKVNAADKSQKDSLLNVLFRYDRERISNANKFSLYINYGCCAARRRV